MHLDTSGIDRAMLAQTVNARYGAAIDRLVFVPKGEDAYALADPRRRYFVRLQEGADTSAALTVAAALRHEAEIEAVLAPISARDGTYCFPFGRFTAAVFPYVDGPSLWEIDASQAQVDGALSVVAEVHCSRVTVPPVRRERFDNPFAGPIGRALGASVRPAGERCGPRVDDVRRLLAAERQDILAALAEMRRLSAACRSGPAPQVVTHGDPNLANFLVDGNGRLHLTDWGEVGVGPPERDLSFFTGDHFERRIRRYVAATGRAALRAEVFTFYQWRWCLQEIADYTSRILFRNVAPQEDEHAWSELASYLPLRRSAMADGRRRTAEALRAVCLHPQGGASA